MPYIDNNAREKLRDLIHIIEKSVIEGYSMTPGEMNYIISLMCLAYVKRKGLSYTVLNEVIGILECVKQEFYRRAVTDYEQKKISENGDIFNDT